MKRTIYFAFAALLLAQAPPAYRQAYHAWRAGDPNLENQAAEAENLAERVQKASQLSFRHGSDRSAFWRELSTERSDNLEWLQNSGAVVELDLAPAAEMQAAVLTATNFVDNDIKSFSRDPDRLIQQLRQALEREKASLVALNAAILDRQRALQRSNEALPGTEAARANTMIEYQRLYSATANATSQAEREAAAWATYYQVLGEAPRAIQAARAPAPVTQSGRITINGVRINNPAPALAPKPVVTTAPASAPEIPKSPGARFAGDWRFPTGGLFHGTQPESVELHVTEEGGTLTGTLVARFRVPAGAPDDPALSFAFRGDVSANRNQSLELETTDGAKGVLELIPGPVPTQMEVNFTTESKPNKLRAGNFLVEKK